jgi:hypothetical protein
MLACHVGIKKTKTTHFHIGYGSVCIPHPPGYVHVALCPSLPAAYLQPTCRHVPVAAEQLQALFVGDK